MQGLIEYYGGELGVLPYPMHCKPSTVTVHEPRGHLFHSLPDSFQVGRYHSLYSIKAKHPKELRITATTADGVIMAIEHESLPMAAVQFHPESIMTNTDVGLKMLSNATIGCATDNNMKRKTPSLDGWDRCEVVCERRDD